MNWQTIDTAPKDRPILAWCEHGADPYVENEATGRLTLYAAHADGMSHCEDGHQIVEWGGGFDDRSYDEPNGANLPDWWHVAGTEHEVAANPTYWAELPPSPHEPVPITSAPGFDGRKS